MEIGLFFGQLTYLSTKSVTPITKLPKCVTFRHFIWLLFSVHSAVLVGLRVSLIKWWQMLMWHTRTVTRLKRFKRSNRVNWIEELVLYYLSFMPSCHLPLTVLFKGSSGSILRVSEVLLSFLMNAVVSYVSCMFKYWLQLVCFSVCVFTVGHSREKF